MDSNDLMKTDKYDQLRQQFKIWGTWYR